MQSKTHIKRDFLAEYDADLPEKPLGSGFSDTFLVIQAIPVYTGFVRAGNRDETEPKFSADRFAEFHQVDIEGTLYTIYSLRSKTKRVSVTQKNDWGWIKVKGKSMNKIKGNVVSINDGDYIFFQKSPNADDNDIVIAMHKDRNSNDFSTVVKRLCKYDKILRSETTETEPEYEPIDIEKTAYKL